MRYLRVLIFGIFAVILMPLFYCGEENPSRDEIPVIRELLGKFEAGVRDRNVAVLDSLIAVEALELGYTSEKILSDIYSVSDSNTFYKFGSREFFYTKNKGAVHCTVLPDSTDPGEPAEITVVKKGEDWLIKRFDLK